jgi:hypothetical protein
VHPAYITVIQFPENTKIVDATTTLSVKRFIKRDNILEIQPAKMSDSGNAPVYYTDKDGKIHFIQLFFKTINPYKGEKPTFYPTVVLTHSKILSPVRVLEKYRKVYGHYPQEPYTLFRYGGIVYVIQRSKVYGDVRIGNNSYLITTTLERN